MNANHATWTWTAPQHRSRSGASHRRRGVPCQDFSLGTNLRSLDGVSVGLMAVADGHGGSRYWLSDVGSRMACELAIAMAGRDLASRPLAAADPSQLETVRRWLADELPPRLLEAWREAIQADWQQRQLPAEHQGEDFSPQTYGSTLGLVVLTPLWWAHTGLGDWDLVLLSDHQPDQLISHESDDSLQGEATESLCLSNANRCFAARTAVYPLSGAQRLASGLVLSTDGIRKSCATDTDHLALSRYLLEEARSHQQPAARETSELDASLDRISREGSGDDVSVAISWFGTLQPSYAAAKAPAPSALQPPSPPLPEQTRSTTAKSSRASAAQAPPAQWPLSLLLLTITLVTGLGAAALWLRQQPLAGTPSLSGTQQQRLQHKIQTLCQQPSLIEPSLLARKNQFRRLHNNPGELNAVLGDQDWLGALIGLSQPGRSKPLTSLQHCPKLAEALRQHWRLQITPTLSTPASDDGLRPGPRYPDGPRSAEPGKWRTSGSANR